MDFKIGVISDTHQQQASGGLLSRLAELWQGARMILHAGDIVSQSVLDDLAALDLGEVHAVAGNMDPAGLAMTLPAKKVITVQGKRIGLAHGWGSPIGLAAKVAREFEDLDCLVFGHSHRPANYVKNQVLFLNPGSAAGNLLGRGTVALLTVGNGLSAEILKL